MPGLHFIIPEVILTSRMQPQVDEAEALLKNDEMELQSFMALLWDMEQVRYLLLRLTVRLTQVHQHMQGIRAKDEWSLQTKDVKNYENKQ
jgi:hypothetical protein